LLAILASFLGVVAAISMGMAYIAYRRDAWARELFRATMLLDNETRQKIDEAHQRIRSARRDRAN